MELFGIGIVFLALGAQIGLRYRASRRPEVRPAAAAKGDVRAAGDSGDARDSEREDCADDDSVGSRTDALKQVYTAFDLDCDGAISSDELLQLGHARRNLGHKRDSWSRERNSVLVSQIGCDKFGDIEESDFVRCAEWCLKFITAVWSSFCVNHCSVS